MWLSVHVTVLPGTRCMIVLVCWFSPIRCIERNQSLLVLQQTMSSTGCATLHLPGPIQCDRGTSCQRVCDTTQVPPPFAKLFGHQQAQHAVDSPTQSEIVCHLIQQFLHGLLRRRRAAQNFHHCLHTSGGQPAGAFSAGEQEELRGGVSRVG